MPFTFVPKVLYLPLMCYRAHLVVLSVPLQKIKRACRKNKTGQEVVLALPHVPVHKYKAYETGRKI